MQDKFKDYQKHLEDLQIESAKAQDDIDKIESSQEPSKHLKELYALKNKKKICDRTAYYIKSPDRLYDKNYLLRHYDAYRDWEGQLGKELVERYQIKSMVDFGCGCGSYLEAAKELGVRVQGFDLMYDTIKDIVDEEILEFIDYGNVMEPISCGKFDCSFSIETAEHILPEFSQVFVQNLTNASERLIILTAGGPRQGGRGHINFREKDFWIKLVEENGFVYLEDEVKKTQEVWMSILLKGYYYLVRNLMIFSKSI